jgi:hypothetical protein
LTASSSLTDGIKAFIAQAAAFCIGEERWNWSKPKFNPVRCNALAARRQLVRHHVGNRNQYFATLKSSLQPAARLVIIDFKADSPNGPPVRHRISPERVTQELKAAGYALVDTLRFLPRQYCLIFDAGNS